MKGLAFASMENYCFEVFEKIPDEQRKNWHLFVDAVYLANPQKTNLSAEVLSKLVGVKNQGGFRYLGKTESPQLVVLFSTGEDVLWRDELDNSLGLFLYYGDNKTPGSDLHKTNLHGNEILRYIFSLASSDDIELRKKIPPVLVFQRHSGLNVKFLGLAVPGIKGKPKKDWLTAVWESDRNGDRFQNYKAFFTILNTSSGCNAEDGFGINLAWLNDIKIGRTFESEYAPKSWKQYIKDKMYIPLIARQEKYRRSKEEQLPAEAEKKNILKAVHDFFIQKDKGYSFEKFASYIVECMDESVVDIEVTRPYKDGGFDAEGRYKIFKNVENSVYVDFYLQAKCYGENNPVAVKDTSRLISRIKNKQFGIMITTSYVADQAYKEILEDGHPIVIINGKNIADFLFNEFELRSTDNLKEWLNINFGDKLLSQM